jgi:exonuclease VII small subunit
MTAIDTTEMDLPEAPTRFCHAFSIPEARLRDIFQKGAALAAEMSKEELEETRVAMEEIADIYPRLRLDTSFFNDGDDYETNRNSFKAVIDRLERALVVLDQYFPEEFPTLHKFTPGMYIREIHVPAGSIFTSITHKTQHPFVISKGVCDICNEVGQVERYHAPYTGITNPGTRRVFLVHSDMVFTTFHVTDITDPDEWILANTEFENETLPGNTVLKCFSREAIQWQE